MSRTRSTGEFTINFIMPNLAIALTTRPSMTIETNVSTNGTLIWLVQISYTTNNEKLRTVRLDQIGRPKGKLTKL